MVTVKLLFDGTKTPTSLQDEARKNIAELEKNDHQDNAWQIEHWRAVQQWLNESTTMQAHTSGSTGAPKEIFLPKADMKRSAQLTALVFSVPDGADVWLPLPASYIAGKMMIVRALVNRWRLWVTPPMAHLGNVSIPAHLHLHLVSMVPAQLLSIQNRLCAQLGTVLLGGGRIDFQLSSRFQNNSTRLIETYGMTETITHIAWRELNASPERPPFQAVPGVVFSTTENDCLVVNAEHLSSGPVHTTDVVELIDEHHFHWLGRADNVIVTGGLKFFPEEWEEKMKEHLPFPFYLVGANDPEWGQRIVLVLEGKPFDVSTILQLWRNIAGAAFTPKEVRFLPTFHYTASHKIIRKLPSQ